MRKAIARKFLLSIWEIVEVALIAGVTVFLIRTFLVQPFLVSGASMEPKFWDGNYLLVDEITYRFREPERGEVIVFRFPHDRSVFFIKRIIGLPGESVIAQNGQIKVLSGGKELVLSEKYLPNGSSSNDSFEIKLAEGQYFVMGDNRYHSFDSRNWGAISKGDIIGVARLRILPINSLELFEPPRY